MIDELNKDGEPIGTEPDKTASDKDAGKPKGQEPAENGSIADIDFSDVPENLREAVKAKTALKAKNLQSGFTKKTTEIKGQKEKLDRKEANLERLLKVQEDIDKDPELGRKLNKTVDDHKAGRVSTPKETKEVVKLIDQKIASTDDTALKQDLRDIRTIVKEEGPDVSNLHEKIKNLEDEIKGIRLTTRLSQTDRVARGIDGLTERFGKDVVDKYRDEIKSNALKVPNLSVRNIFLQLANDEDISAAYLNEAKIREKKDLDRRKRGLEPAGEGTVSTVEIPRDKVGRVDIKKYVSNIIQKEGLAKNL